MTWDDLVLRWDLWGMDDTPYRVLSNKIVTTRTASECAICFESIPVGVRVRAQSEVYEGQAKTFRICPACCDAMALDSLDGDCLRMEERTRIGMDKVRTLTTEQTAEQKTDTRVDGVPDGAHGDLPRPAEGRREG